MAARVTITAGFRDPFYASRSECFAVKNRSSSTSSSRNYADSLCPPRSAAALEILGIPTSAAHSAHQRSSQQPQRHLHHRSRPSCRMPISRRAFTHPPQDSKPWLDERGVFKLTATCSQATWKPTSDGNTLPRNRTHPQPNPRVG